MKNYNDFLNDIKNHEVKKVYLCYGNEIYLRDKIINELKNRYISKAFESLNYVYLEGKDVKVEDIINACETLPFMTEKKIVIVENLPFFSSGKSGVSNDESQLCEYVFNLNDLTCLVIIVNEEKIDGRKTIVKSISSVGSIIEFNKVKGDELIKWVEKIYRKNNKKISRININYFIENSGYLESNSNKTLYDLENEIIKICNYLGNRNEVYKEDIDAVLVKTLQNNIFKLVDGIGQKNVDMALTILNEMILSNEPLQLILHMIIRQFRLLLMAKLLEEKGYSYANIVQKMGVHSFTAKKVLEQSRNFSQTELEKALIECLETDKRIKKGNIDNRLAVEMLIVNFSKRDSMKR